MEKHAQILLDYDDVFYCRITGVFTHMVSGHYEEALNYKFKDKKANISRSHSDQWLSGSSTQATRLQSRWIVRLSTHQGPNVFFSL